MYTLNNLKFIQVKATLQSFIKKHTRNKTKQNKNKKLKRMKENLVNSYKKNYYIYQHISFLKMFSFQIYFLINIIFNSHLPNHMRT